MVCTPHRILFRSSNKDGWEWLVGYVARMVDRRGACRVLVGKHEGKRSHGRTERIWKDNITMDLQEVGLGHGLD